MGFILGHVMCKVLMESGVTGDIGLEPGCGLELTWVTLRCLWNVHNRATCTIAHWWRLRPQEWE